MPFEKDGLIETSADSKGIREIGMKAGKKDLSSDDVDKAKEAYGIDPELTIESARKTHWSEPGPDYDPESGKDKQIF